MLKFNLILTTLVFCNACTTTSATDQNLKSWQGEKADRLVEVMGQPAAVSSNRDGGKTMTYQLPHQVPHIISSDHRGGTERVVMDNADCTVSFMVDARGMVKSVGTERSAGDCGRVVPSNPHQALAH